MQIIISHKHFLIFALAVSCQLSHAVSLDQEVILDVSKSEKILTTEPKKIQITPATNEIAHAMYYKSVASRIEKYGTKYFPQNDGKRIYGNLTVWVPISRNGYVYESNGGPKIERSSGNVRLDRAALEIVRAASPFGRFPLPNNRSSDEEVWELLFPFNFTTEDAPHNSAANTDAGKEPR